MLYYLANTFEFDSLWNLFRYLSFRMIGAMGTSLLISMLFGRRLIAWLRTKQKSGQPIRDDGPQSHLITKVGTPTMGGLLVLISFCISIFLWGNWDNQYLFLCTLVTLCFGIIGLIDDYAKVSSQTHRGVPGRVRLFAEFAIAGFITYVIVNYAGSGLRFPFLKNAILDLGPLYILFGSFVIVSFANAVNLTDGLDGLAIMPCIIATASLIIITYLSGNVNFAEYLQIPYIRGVGELAVFCGALVGAGLGFLWFNAPPAMVFMGDTGSLSLGAALGSVAVAARHELVLVIIGGLFVLEAISVVIQVAFFKLTGRRVFLMAPIHHHFEHKGWSESTIVIRFWIIAIMLALVGLSTLKLR